MNTQNLKPKNDIVLIKKLVKTLDKKYGNILLPQSVDKNCSLGIGQIIDLGDKAKETGLSINDYILYDYYSVFDNSEDYVITKVENIIVQLTESEANNYINNYVIR